MAPAPAISCEMDVKEFVVNEGHGVKGLADLGLRILPEQFIQPPEERVINMDVSIEESIPILDVSNWDDPKVAELICNAAEKWGFFQIVNHGVPLRVLEDMKDGACQFFGLLSEDKKKFLKDNSPTKDVRFGTSFNPQAEKSMEWKDYLSCYYVSDEEADALWPPACRYQMLEYMKRTESVITKILEALMKRPNIKEIGETMQSILIGSKRINLNYYPICPNPELTVGVGRHTDVSTLTILLQDETGGLYVWKQETCSWLHVPPVKGSLIVNIGDALQIMSNGRYKSVEHRVAANGEKNRISVPIFVNPRPTDVIGPLRQVLEGGEKAIYRRLVYSDYVKHFFRKSHGGKQTIEFVEI